VDANLRPEGKNGPLVRTLASYAAYYRRWAAGWEAQLRYAAGLPGLRTTRTLPALRAAAEAGLLTRDDADALEAASRVATRARNAIMLVRGRAGDQLPGHGRDLAAVARAMGYPPAATRARCSRTTAAPPAAPAGWSSASSTPDGTRRARDQTLRRHFSRLLDVEKCLLKVSWG